MRGRRRTRPGGIDAIDLGPTDALLVVDVQNDFCPGGAVPVPDGDKVVPVLNAWMRAAADAGAAIYASRDWHPPDHASFRGRGGPWPPHCVRGTRGADFHPLLRLPAGAVVVSKAEERDRDAYSAFDGTGLAEALRARGATRVLVGGLAEDYCVRASVLDALAAGLDVLLLVDATRPVDAAPGDGARAREEMVRRGARPVEG